MRIAIISQYFYPETGAPQNRLLELANILDEQGWEIMVVTAMPNYPTGRIFKEYSGKFSHRESIGNLKVLRYWLYASKAPKAIPRIISMLSFSFTGLFSRKKLKEFAPDFLLAESPPLTLAYSGYLLAKWSSAKFIMNVSDIWPLSAKELGSISDGKLYRAIERLEKFLYGKAFLCTGQSEEIVEHIKKSGAKNVLLFRNGVDVKRFAKQSKEKTSKNGKLRIVYAGLLGVAQKVGDIVRAINFSKLNAELHIYGDGAERKAIEDFLLTEPERGVWLHQPVARESVPSLLSEYDCALIPLVRNIYGAVPSKIYEAMAAGLPILFSGSGEGAKIIRENNVGLVNNPGDYEKLSMNITQLEQDHELRLLLSANCVRTAAESFDRNKIIPEFAEKLKSYLSAVGKA